MCAKLPRNPRRSAGAYSTASSTAPPYSPPTPMPCSTRSVTSSTGAHQPIASYDGSRPIAAVPTPMITSVSSSIFLRPTRSPKWPKMKPPTGRARNPTAKVRERRELGRDPLRPLKNSLLEHEPGGGAVEEEVVPLDGGADGGGERDAARGRRRRRLDSAVVRDIGGPFGDCRAGAGGSEMGLIEPKPLRWNTSGWETSACSTACSRSMTMTWSPASTSSWIVQSKRASPSSRVRAPSPVTVTEQPVEAVLDRPRQLPARVVVVVGQHRHPEVAGAAQHRPGPRGGGHRERHQRRVQADRGERAGREARRGRRRPPPPPRRRRSGRPRTPRAAGAGRGPGWWSGGTGWSCEGSCRAGEQRVDGGRERASQSS